MLTLVVDISRLGQCRPTIPLATSHGWEMRVTTVPGTEELFDKARWLSLPLLVLLIYCSRWELFPLFKLQYHPPNSYEKPGALFIFIPSLVLTTLYKQLSMFLFRRRKVRF